MATAIRIKISALLITDPVLQSEYPVLAIAAKKSSVYGHFPAR
jgi:hypothetical protein